MLTSKLKILFFTLLLSLCTGDWSHTFAQSYEVKLIKVGKGSEQVFAGDFYDGKLFFCSNAKSKHAKNVVNEDNSRFLNLYQITFEEDLSIKKSEKPLLLSESVNSTLNEGPIFFNKQTGQAFFSSNLVTDSTEISLALYTTQYSKETGLFSEREIVKFDLGDGNYSNPTVSDDGNLIVFSFTGLTDTSSNLYHSNRINGTWSTPQPLEEINTKHNETFPRIYGNTLYFASDRPGGAGGLDIYKCSFIEGKLGEITSLPKPINSSSDDFLFFQVSNDQGFFSSNRLKGQDKIYRFKLNIPTPSEFIETDINFCYTLQDEVILNEEQYQYMWEFGDGAKENGAIVEHCYQDSGLYEVSCHLMDIETKEVEKDIINGIVEVVSEFPIITYEAQDDKIEIGIEQKWSRKNFSNYYWLIDDQIISDKKIHINHPVSKPITIKAVLWNTDQEEDVIGLTKTITPQE